MRQRIWLYIFLVLGNLLSMGCSPNRQPEASFYYWKSVFRLSAKERKSLKELNVNRLYIKFFDVDWNYETQQALPVAQIQFAENIPNSLAVVPTVFITNQTMLQISEEDLPALAQKLTAKIFAMVAAQHLNVPEIQLDCDWSGKSREKFFKIVSLVKQKLAPKSIQLSATIRLHQLKFVGKTGVPPVDRGVLMFYNMGSLDGLNTDNSILDLNIARHYLHRLKDYPIPLDVALPIYQWAVLKRENRVINLLTHVPLDSLTDTSRYEPLGAKKVRVRRSHYLQSVYLYPGDELRLEEVSLAELQGAAELTEPIVNQPKPHIIFYYLDESTSTRYAPQDLTEVVNRFR